MTRVPLLVLLPLLASAQAPAPGYVFPRAAPVPPQTLTRTTPILQAAPPLHTVYSIGEPTDDEQYYLELINRARANPSAEGARLAATSDANILSAYGYFGVNLAIMQSEFNALAVRPPLAMNAALTTAARLHSQDMLTNMFQGHTGSAGSTLGSRATAAGYGYSTLGENVFSYATSPWYGHAGFQVDWGPGDGTGMQPGRGHRVNIHGNFREVGIGQINGSNGSVGPQLVTQDFGTSSSSTAFVTGVAYHDINGNGFYDPGEGIGGLTVEVSGASYSAVTSKSGGYAVPVPTTSTTRTVWFEGNALSSSASATIASGQNVKVDFAGTYTPPTIAGPAAPSVGYANTYSFNAVGGATAHEWQVAAKTAAPADAADSLAGVNVVTTGAYSALSTGTKFAGTGAYHLAHPTLADQGITYPASLYVGANASIQFRSRLGYAGAGQAARVEISTDNGSTWTALYTQTGSGGAGESTFALRTVSLAGYAAQQIRVRFVYTFSGGSYFAQTDNNSGWFIDSVSFPNLFTLSGTSVSTVASGNRFAFTPAAATTYLLAVRPIVSGRAWAFGPGLEVVAANTTPPVGGPTYATWAAQHETTANLPTGTLGNNPTGDYNNDGRHQHRRLRVGSSARSPARPIPW